MTTKKKPTLTFVGEDGATVVGTPRRSEHPFAVEVGRLYWIQNRVGSGPHLFHKIYKARFGSLVLGVWRSNEAWDWNVWRGETAELAIGYTRSRWRAMNVAEVVARTLVEQT